MKYDLHDHLFIVKNSTVFADDPVPIWHQDICNHRNDIAWSAFICSAQVWWILGLSNSGYPAPIPRFCFRITTAWWFYYDIYCFENYFVALNSINLIFLSLTGLPLWNTGSQNTEIGIQLTFLAAFLKCNLPFPHITTNKHCLGSDMCNSNIWIWPRKKWCGVPCGKCIYKHGRQCGLCCELDSFTVSLHSTNGRQMPAVRAAQRDCQLPLRNGGNSHHSLIC